MISLIANPASRSGRGKRLWPQWSDALARSGRLFRLFETASREDCEKQARHAAVSRGALVAAVGGDGTINAVITGMMRARHDNPVGKFPSLGVLYAGTSPDFCRFHAIPTEPEAAMRTLLAGESRLIDIVALVFTGHVDGNSRENHLKEFVFASSCNIGLGAATAAFANMFRRIFGDALGTGLGLVKAMLAHKPFACRLNLDGEPVLFSRVNHIIILKNPHIASGLRVNLPVLPDDGRMYAVVLHGHSRARLLGLARALYRGDWHGRPGVFTRSCHTVTVEATPAQTVEYDGDPRGMTPVRADLRPGALSLVCGTTQGGCSG